jgi:hypothetical protein
MEVSCRRDAQAALLPRRGGERASNTQFVAIRCDDFQVAVLIIGLNIRNKKKEGE